MKEAGMTLKRRIERMERESIVKEKTHSDTSKTIPVANLSRIELIDATVKFDDRKSPTITITTTGESTRASFLFHAQLCNQMSEFIHDGNSQQ